MCTLVRRHQNLQVACVALGLPARLTVEAELQNLAGGTNSPGPRVLVGKGQENDSSQAPTHALLGRSHRCLKPESGTR